MKLSRSYRLGEFIHWTRRKLYVLLALSALPVALYQWAGWHWAQLPWAVAALLATATSFIVGFRSSQTYGRTLEAQQVWASIAALSRHWGLICRDFPGAREQARRLVHRHLAWLTLWRYRLREPRLWEAAALASNREYREDRFVVPEHAQPLDQELDRLLKGDNEDRAALAVATDRPAALLGLQSALLRELADTQKLPAAYHIEMQRTLKDLSDQFARAERLKTLPYPRQYAAVNTILVWLFATLLPWCVLRDFERLNELVAAPWQGQMVWLALPFSVLVSWIYVSLDHVGESTENPFEGSANDVPISSTCRLVEIELRQLLGEYELPLPLVAAHGILL